MRPICTVKGEGFTDMMKFLEPGYCLPSPSTFMKAIEIKYSDAMNKLCVKFLSCDQVCLTEDVWTSSAMEAYLGVTAHLINAEWDMQTYIVVVKPLEGSHTAENIVQWNIDVLHDFSIAESKVYAIVHDNGSNMVAAVTDLREVLPKSAAKCYFCKMCRAHSAALFDWSFRRQCHTSYHCCCMYFSKAFSKKYKSSGWIKVKAKDDVTS